MFNGCARRQQIAHVAFSFAERSVDQACRESARREALRQRNRLNRWPADVQARDESKDAHAASL